MKIDWKALTSFVTFILTIGGGFYKLNQDNQQLIVEQTHSSNLKQIRWQIDSLKMERKIQKIKWELQDSIKIQIARLEDRLK
tara:strand:- start:637 stop:882 length:246 start_codon:yes stop_codon:yes gene_type:complete